MARKESARRMEEARQMLGQGESPTSYMENYPNNERLRNEINSQKIIELTFEQLEESPLNCFKKPQGELREEFKGSLKANGQINPIIVRPRECVEDYIIRKDYEILVGHSRVELLKEIAREERRNILVKAIIIHANDLEATCLISQSNIQRDTVTEVEKARAYRNTYEALKKDKTNLLNRGNIAGENESNGGKSTADIVADMYGVSASKLKRIMPLADCIEVFARLYERKKITQEIMAGISKLHPKTQECLYEELNRSPFELTKELLKRFKEREEQEKIDAERYGQRTKYLKNNQIYEARLDYEGEELERLKLEDEKKAARLKEKEKEANKSAYERRAAKTKKIRMDYSKILMRKLGKLLKEYLEKDEIDEVLERMNEIIAESLKDKEKVAEEEEVQDE